MAGSSRRAAIVVRAHAKINLTLRVLGRRSDGYHELHTIFQSVALHDTLTVRQRRGPFRLDCDNPSCPTDESNLVWRAAAALARLVGRRSPDGVVVRLTKRIPMESGLGGGSSDAAAALVALGKLWRVRFDRLRGVAASIGADVPYFLAGGTALGVDRGDTIVPLPDFAPAWVVLAVPSFGVSTREAFASWDRLTRAKRTRRGGREDTMNDLQPLVARRHPPIARLVQALQRAGARHAAMSGSGSAVFGLFDRRSDAVAAAAAVPTSTRARGSRGGVSVVVTRTLGRAAYRRLSGIAARR